MQAKTVMIKTKPWADRIKQRRRKTTGGEVPGITIPKVLKWAVLRKVCSPKHREETDTGENRRY